MFRCQFYRSSATSIPWLLRWVLVAEIVRVDPPIYISQSGDLLIPILFIILQNAQRVDPNIPESQIFGNSKSMSYSSREHIQGDVVGIQFKRYMLLLSIFKFRLISFFIATSSSKRWYTLLKIFKFSFFIAGLTSRYTLLNHIRSWKLGFSRGRFGRFFFRH